MTTSSITTRRLLLAGGFAIAIAITPAVALVAQPTHSIPEVSGVPCTGGRSSGACIGLEENAEDMGPQPVPRSTISSSP
jgi:hypothetical protein